MLTAIEIWWIWWMLLQSVLMACRWRRYKAEYVAQVGEGHLWAIWLMAILYIACCPVTRLWTLFQTAIWVPKYELQLDILERNGHTRRVSATISLISDGESIAKKLYHEDSTVTTVFYQVVQVHTQGVVESKDVAG